MMLPASMVSPPNFLTPRRWPAESRPLREEPPAFLCAMGMLLLAARYRGDLHFREVLAMTALAMSVLAALLFEGDDLVAFAVFQNFGRDGGARDQRQAMLRLVAAQHEDFAECDGAAGVAFELLDGQNVVFGDLIFCLLYTSDAADDLLCVDLGGRRIIK